MTYGFVTYAIDGVKNTYSPSYSSDFFYQSITTNTQQQLAFPGFVQSGGAVTPTAKFSINTSPTPYQSGAIVTTAGVFNQPNSTFYLPQKYLVLGSTVQSYFRQSGIVNSIPCNVIGFGKKTATAGSYGIEVSSTDGNLTIDQNYKTYYVHKNSSGNSIRTASASSIPSFTTLTTNYTQTQVQNVTFDKAYDNPPLIFITECSGPVSFNGMITNSLGKYIGASIIAASTFVRVTVDNYAAYGSNTYTFSYFIVSQENPLYGDTSTHGINVFDESSNIVFTSKYFVPSFLLQTYSTPYMNFQFTGPSSDGSGLKYFEQNTTTGVKTANQGICINTFPSMCGFSQYVQFVFTVAYGPICIFGKFLTVSSTSWNIKGYGTCAFLSVLNAPTNSFLWESYDFQLSSSSNFALFFSDYTRA